MVELGRRSELEDCAVEGSLRHVRAGIPPHREARQ